MKAQLENASANGLDIGGGQPLSGDAGDGLKDSLLGSFIP